MPRTRALEEAFFLGQGYDESNDEEIMTRGETISQVYNAGPSINAMVTSKKK